MSREGGEVGKAFGLRYLRLFAGNPFRDLSD